MVYTQVAPGAARSEPYKGGMRAIGFAGTAKNTGKTTTALKVLEASTAAGFSNAITSIGLDGEEKDQVTGLPKPRYNLQPGDVVATAEDCLKSATASYEILQVTPIHTSLGQIQIVRVTQAGAIALAGPNRRSDVQYILKILEDLGTDLAVVDGALNRIVPMICANGMVLATGAAYLEDSNALAQHAALLVSLFDFPLAPDFPLSVDQISLAYKAEIISQLGSGSLFGSNDVKTLLSRIETTSSDTLIIPGACLPLQLSQVIENLPANRIERLVLGNPLKLIASGEPQQWNALFSKAEQRGIRLSYLENIPLIFMTVNPFFPRYEPSTFSYQPALVDAATQLKRVRACVQTIPVFNLMMPPLPDLCHLIGLTK